MHLTHYIIRTVNHLHSHLLAAAGKEQPLKPAEFLQILEPEAQQPELYKAFPV